MGLVLADRSAPPSPQPAPARAAAATPDVIAVWLRVTAATRPQNLPAFLGELAEPDFTLDSCRESARLTGQGDDHYSAHWYCRFSRDVRDEFADLRLLKRLTGAGFHILRFDGAVDG